MDIVYIVGAGSSWNNNELRYSMRSAAKYFRGIRNVYIIGNKPDFINSKVIHHQVGDVNVNNKERSIYEKILFACQLQDLSDNFLCMYDDHLMLKKMPLRTFPYYYRHDDLLECGKKKQPSDRYRISIFNTYQVLKAKNLPVLNYDNHVPIIFNKKKFIEVMPGYDWTLSCGFLVKSIYCNTVGVTGQHMEDLKIKKKLSEQEITELIRGQVRMSYSNPGLTETLKAFIHALFPDPSPWEK